MIMTVGRTFAKCSAVWLFITGSRMLCQAPENLVIKVCPLVVQRVRIKFYRIFCLLSTTHPRSLQLTQKANKLNMQYITYHENFKNKPKFTYQGILMLRKSLRTRSLPVPVRVCF